MKPTFGSLFSGVGGFDCGLERAGWRVAWQAETDPYCSAVLAAHWPGVPNLGDVSRLGRTQHHVEGQQDDAKTCESDHARIADVDLVCGGFPCQDLSVAGKHKGLDGARSGLWFEFHRILSELRPTFVLVENVPGLLSSNQGRDFAVVLNGLGELWPAVGWAILDSQHFGVPQRRRRVYIVGGPTRASVQQILSICEGGDWHSPQGRAAREDIAGPTAGGAYGTGRRSEDDPNLVLAHSLRGQANARHREDSNTYVTHALTSEGFDASEDGDGTSQHGIQQAQIVRRLTPTECERLQGFPDSWTDVEYRGKPTTADGPRYRALGNAVTVPVIEYLGLRIAAVMT